MRLMGKEPRNRSEKTVSMKALALGGALEMACAA
jgi:hypothetical protein